MTSKLEKCVMEIEQNIPKMLPRYPRCSNEGTQCDCRLHNMVIQPQMATGKPWSLWKTCLVCLLACLISSAIVVLVGHFGLFGKPTSSTTIIIRTDGNSSQDGRTPCPTPSPGSSTSPGPSSTTPSTPTTSSSTSTVILTTSVVTTIPTTTTTVFHRVDIEEDEEE